MAHFEPCPRPQLLALGSISYTGHLPLHLPLHPAHLSPGETIFLTLDYNHSFGSTRDWFWEPRWNSKTLRCSSLLYKMMKFNEYSWSSLFSGFPAVFLPGEFHGQFHTVAKSLT